MRLTHRPNHENGCFRKDQRGLYDMIRPSLELEKVDRITDRAILRFSVRRIGHFAAPAVLMYRVEEAQKTGCFIKGFVDLPAVSEWHNS